jgi:predicted neutral ceramidase superfamily lipid hydrolase
MLTLQLHDGRQEYSRSLYLRALVRIVVVLLVWTAVWIVRGADLLTSIISVLAFVAYLSIEVISVMQALRKPAKASEYERQF